MITQQQAKDALIVRLQDEEGFREYPYKDSLGNYTVGYGQLINQLQDEHYPMSQSRALELLRNKVNEIYKDIELQISWFKYLDPIRQTVLVDMAYNMGMNDLLGFKNTLYFIRNGKYQMAAEHMLESKWAEQVGDRAINLSKIMESGKL